MGLPKAKGCDVILVVVDRFSKYNHFLALKYPYTAKSVADIFVKEIVRLHGFPSSIVSDRDKVFLSHFWNELFRLAGTKLRKSTVYHPQSDGHTEVVNRGLETYLRCFCNEHQREWILWLSWAEFWYSTTYQRALDMSPFQVVYGRKPPALLSYGEGGTSNSSIDEQLRERDIALAALREHLLLAQQQIKLYADCKRRHVEFQIGELVFVKIRPYRQVTLRSKRNEKLSSRYFGPYKILEKIGEVAYRLLLPAGAVIHPVFHPEEVREYMLDKSGNWEVLVAWQGLPDYEAPWEDCDEMKKFYPNLHLEDKVNLKGESQTVPNKKLRGAVFNLLCGDEEIMLMDKIQNHFRSEIIEVRDSDEDIQAALKAAGLV
ncbi:Transposon Ty3-G Gag-Pol polyprotein [Cucumis melo var. makuwa]|uniref:Transposon Ty3-G Gag-Pol polyprotein n=1 Tax=Cucumis melo var. makuwa TaxID=1194695 RepID=A0A5A7VFU8_CUCMM|nr:Transposon Ty3-G Gag-Pol polyprotein [Cucumis melo var. makuwa]TYK15224.1 Transposon Ty3-G Gag-Pol polyprotein [Cucumis melo var. makuwa]